MNPVKPTQVVDLAPMLGKSLQELEAKLGASRPQGICRAWDLPDGMLTACNQSGGSAMNHISYRFPPSTFFAPRIAVATPEEMASLVKIDLQGRKPNTEFIGGYAYDDLTLNGRSADVAFDGGPKLIVGVRVDLK